MTARVGRTIQGTVLPMICPELSSLAPASDLPMQRLADRLSKGAMLIGAPNVGKTTVLRELARLLSLGQTRVVVIVDKSLEICGTGIVPHSTIGNARVLTVDHPSNQHKVMIQAVENQSPDFVIVDEISSKEECQAARTITGRGVALIASVHGESLAQLCNDPERSVLIGGVQSVTLSAREAEKRDDKARQVSRRYLAPVFGTAFELRGFYDWIIHSDLEKAVDAYLDYQPFLASWQTRENQEVRSIPLLACRPPGSAGGYQYAKLDRSDALDTTSINFHEVDHATGARKWIETGPRSNIYQRAPPSW